MPGHIWVLSWACQAVLRCADPGGHGLDATAVITHISEREGGVFWAEVPGMRHASVGHLMLSGLVTGPREVGRLLCTAFRTGISAPRIGECGR